MVFVIKHVVLICLFVTCSFANGNWMKLGEDINGEASLDNFGGAVAVSLDGSRVAVGECNNDGNGVGAGHARVYEWLDTTQTWSQLGRDIDGASSGDNCGDSVSLSTDGMRLVVGAYLNDAGGEDAGHVRVYEWSAAASEWLHMGQDING